MAYVMLRKTFVLRGGAIGNNALHKISLHLRPKPKVSSQNAPLFNSNARLSSTEIT